ncbi:MerR family transcriptional regulator [Gulosibacter sp. 10]|uniref:MerR family transcriptional regulator n=1 Tax=Gulosibacter sp. 10 TaxID=1255570 RepID=UPI00097EBF27|nr:MerR family transcriptional regulator [Gulosibacter sp. 10]SJM50052.1 transcriptional regulator, MerR family [Gulosibacter sp. 10]
MAWSTRQLAELTGVTLRSIRHWHEIGLLPEPGRLTNGYKQYTAEHLVLALRIKRLAGLGFGLDDIARMLESETHAGQSLLDLRAELAERIAELERIRADVDALVDGGIAPDLSPEALLAMEALGADPSSRNVAIVLAHLMRGEDLATLVDVLNRAPEEFTALNERVLSLPDDASESECAALAERAVLIIGGFLAEHADSFPALDSPSGVDAGALALEAVVIDDMNRAQRRVMQLVFDRLDGSFPAG